MTTGHVLAHSIHEGVTALGGAGTIVDDAEGHIKKVDQGALTSATSRILPPGAWGIDTSVVETIGETSDGHIGPASQVGTDLPEEDVRIATFVHTDEDVGDVLDEGFELVQGVGKSREGGGGGVGLLEGIEDGGDDETPLGLDGGGDEVEPGLIGGAGEGVKDGEVIEVEGIVGIQGFPVPKGDGSVTGDGVTAQGIGQGAQGDGEALGEGIKDGLELSPDVGMGDHGEDKEGPLLIGFCDKLIGGEGIEGMDTGSKFSSEHEGIKVLGQVLPGLVQGLGKTTNRRILWEESGLPG